MKNGIHKIHTGIPLTCIYLRDNCTSFKTNSLCSDECARQIRALVFPSVIRIYLREMLASHLLAVIDFNERFHHMFAASDEASFIRHVV